MNKKTIIATIVIIIVVAGGVVLIKMAAKSTEDPAAENALENPEKIAENWILNNSPSYRFDGSDLKMVSEEKASEEELYSFVFSFKSRVSGYGNRTDEMTAQVITSHTIEVVVKDGEVVSAITDGVYDEMKEEMTGEDAPETIKIKLYFVKVAEGQEEIVEIERLIPYNTVATARAAIAELLRGPLAAEKNEGLSTSINEEVEIQSISVESGVASVDFSEELEEGVAGSARVTAIREQIEKTLLQFNTVDQVVISVNGRTEDVLQP